MKSDFAQFVADDPLESVQRAEAELALRTLLFAAGLSGIKARVLARRAGVRKLEELAALATSLCLHPPEQPAPVPVDGPILRLQTRKVAALKQALELKRAMAEVRDQKPVEPMPDPKS